MAIATSTAILLGAGISAAAGLATTIMGARAAGRNEYTPPPTPTLPSPAEAEAQAIEKAKEEARKKRALSVGFEQTLLTGPGGLTSTAPTTKKTLLGQ